MNIIDMFKRNKIFTIEQLFYFIQNKISYGWIDKIGNTHNGVNRALDYCLQSPKELLTNKIGICWDNTELCRSFFETMTHLQIETYYLFYEDNAGCPSHTILVFYKNNKVYWFEPMFNNSPNNNSGIHEYNDIKTLLKDFENKFIKYSLYQKSIPNNYLKQNLKLYQYDKPRYHINGYEMREHINQSKEIILK